MIDPASHVALANPRNNAGLRILRRGYNFLEGADSAGKTVGGLFVGLQPRPAQPVHPAAAQALLDGQAERVPALSQQRGLRHPRGCRAVARTSARPCWSHRALPPHRAMDGCRPRAWVQGAVRRRLRARSRILPPQGARKAAACRSRVPAGMLMPSASGGTDAEAKLEAKERTGPHERGPLVPTTWLLISLASVDLARLSQEGDSGGAAIPRARHARGCDCR
jgi:hypothetical protein